MNPDEKIDRYREAIRFLAERTNYETFRQIPYSEMAAGLFRFRSAAESLGLLESPFYLIHVAGTKGKGSVSTILERVLREHGFSTGLFTSPHLARVEERFAVDGRTVAGDEFADALLELRGRLDGISPSEPTPAAEQPAWTFFEISVLLALLLFRQKKVDVAILETGLGGRFDATNICRSDLSVITSISYDHQELLGTAIEQIAAEKAGIIKPNRPVVSGVLCELRLPGLSQSANPGPTELTAERIEAAEAVIRRAAADQNAPLTEIARLSEFTRTAPLSALGIHQRYNAEIALAALAELEKKGILRLQREKTAAALADLTIPARIEVISREPLLLVDGAHNRQSAAALADTVRSVWPGRPKTLVFATTFGKDAAGMLSELVPAFDRIVLTAYGQSARSLPAAELEKIAAEALSETDRAKIALLPEGASPLEPLQRGAEPNRLFCFAGSFYFAAKIVNLLAESTCFRPSPQRDA